MKRIVLFSAFIITIILPSTLGAQQVPVLTKDIALKLAEKPLHCINQEYPNKTAHVINAEADAKMTPQQLHPSFYGCFDWHSSVHGHWMLVKLLKVQPDISKYDEIVEILDGSFRADKIKVEADYFNTWQVAKNFERTYGWAWILKLDEELAKWDHPKAKIWHQNLKPLTDEILRLWKDYLPKQTYPNRTGVHPNTAFAMSFAIDWARQMGDTTFEKELSDKAKTFYLSNTKTPAYLEPDGSDFFSPSLEIAELMSRILPQKDLKKWIHHFYEKRSFAIITTHYTNIKLVVEQLPHAQNAAMLFDEETLEPLYKLEIGQAGSSFTFEVAEKNRIPRFILHSARKKVEKDVVNLDKTIVKLQQEKYEVEKLKTDLAEKRDSTETKRDNLQKLNDQLQVKLHNFQKLYEEEHRKLQFGNKVENFIDSYVKGKSRKEVVKDFVKILEQEKFRKTQDTHKVDSEKLKVVKRKVTQELKKESVQQNITETVEKLQTEKKKERAIWLKIGQRVRIIGSASIGTIEKIDKNDKVTLNYGLFKTQISADELERI
jgi:hypothetical protein